MPRRTFPPSSQRRGQAHTAQGAHPPAATGTGLTVGVRRSPHCRPLEAHCQDAREEAGANPSPSMDPATSPVPAERASRTRQLRSLGRPPLLPAEGLQHPPHTLTRSCQPMMPLSCFHG